MRLPIGSLDFREELPPTLSCRVNRQLELNSRNKFVKVRIVFSGKGGGVASNSTGECTYALILLLLMTLPPSLSRRLVKDGSHSESCFWDVTGQGCRWEAG
ncbi:hypothetical protein AX14_003076, partial [Amanita brunnescens Koide BX004]